MRAVVGDEESGTREEVFGLAGVGGSAGLRPCLPAWGRPLLAASTAAPDWLEFE